MASNAAVVKKKRRRLAFSCEQCRQRKIKCDRSRPCDHCRLSQLECTYAPHPGPATTANTTIAAATAAASPQVTSFLSHHSNSPISLDSQTEISKHGVVDGASGLESNPTVQQLVERVRELEQKLSETSVNKALEQYRLDADSAGAPIKGFFQKIRYFGQSHWMNCIPPFKLIVDVLLRQEADPSSEINILLQKCKILGRELKGRDISLSPVAPQLIDYIPTREVANKLIQSYLETFEPIYRVLHIPSFLKEYEAYWLDPKAVCEPFVTKLLLIMAIGMVFHAKDEATVSRASARQWIYAAHSWLSTPCEKYRLSIEGLQIQILLLVARLTHDINGDLLWLSAGYLLRAAMQMGLHMDADMYALGRLPAQDIQLRRKLWATVLELLVQTSMDSGGLPLIRTGDYDCKLPLNADDLDLGEGPESFISTVKPHNQFTHSSLQIMLAKSLPLRLEVAAFVNDFRLDSTTYDKTIRLSEELLKVCNTDSATFKSFGTSSRRPTDFQTNMVELLIRQYLFVLHHPYAIKAKSDHAYYYSRKICLDSALLFLSRTSQSQGPTLTHLRLQGGGIFRGLPLQFVAFIGDELIHRIETDATPFSESATFLDKRSELRKCLENFQEFTLDRIRCGHPNVRSHVMLTALLAQADAMVNGSSIQDALYEAIKSSLEVCYEVLRVQLGSPPLRADPVVNTEQLSGISSGSMQFLVDLPTSDPWLDFGRLDNKNSWFFSSEEMDSMNWVS